MNRKQRRAALKQSPAADTAAQLFAQARLCQQQNKLNEAARAYQRLLALKPDHAEASNNLACVLQAQGKLAEASAQFARALALTPQLFEQFSAICPTLVAVLPPLGEIIRRANLAWPKRAPLDSLLGGSGLAALAGDALLLTVLRSSPVRDVALERALTALRAALLDQVAAIDDAALTFMCALAQQCFINEYVFATTSAEQSLVEQLAAKRGKISPAQLAAFAMYAPLHALPDAQSLLDRTWPQPLDAVVTQQWREPMQERALRSSIARLTAIEDDVSLRVQQQYEENPYPRWAHAAVQEKPIAIEDYLRGMFPAAGLTPLGNKDALDVLVAGCGTGWHTIGFARKFQGCRMLAIDLSLSSLAYAKRKTPPALAARIDYAQADILKLAGLARSFDVIDASGVLHHMVDPLAGWRALVALLRPHGLMHVGLYSELGRRDILAARRFIVEHGYGTSAAEIRRARQDLLATPLASLVRFNDFFATSECRDMLFHVQESQLTIPAIKAFLAGHGLKFLGFEFAEPVLRRYRALFAEQRWSMTDLDRWHDIETKYPDTFSGMYQFWVRKT
jgi:SAM-dependent methyltransferase